MATMTHAARSAVVTFLSAVTSAPSSPCRLMRRKRSAARSKPSPIHRRRMSPSRQRLMFRVTCRSVPIRFSMQFVVAKKRRSVGGSPSFSTVSVSSKPSRTLAAASAWPFRSSHVARAVSWRRAAAALAADTPAQARPDVSLARLRHEGVEVAPLVELTALDHRGVAEDIAERLAQPLPPSITTASALEREPARKQVLQQLGTDHGVLRRAQPQAQRDLAAVARDPQDDDHRLLGHHDAVHEQRHHLEPVQPPRELLAQPLPVRRTTVRLTALLLLPGCAARAVAPPDWLRTGASTPRRGAVASSARSAGPGRETPRPTATSLPAGRLPHARAPHLHAPPAEGELRRRRAPVMMGARRVMPALGARQRHGLVAKQLVQRGQPLRMDPREQVLARARHPGEHRLHQVHRRRARAILRLRSLRSRCLFVIGGSLAPAWGPFVLVDAILTPTREPSLLSSQIQQDRDISRQDGRCDKHILIGYVHDNRRPFATLEDGRKRSMGTNITTG